MNGFQFSVFSFRCQFLSSKEHRENKKPHILIRARTGYDQNPGGAVREPSLQSGGGPLISVIIPTLNEGENLGKLLSGLPPDPEVEIILVDGGSTDETLEVAGRFSHVRVLTSPKGRGRQMNAGALASRGELLVFLHADTCLTTAHLGALRQAATDPAFQAGAFAFGLRPDLPALRFIVRGVNWRCSLFNLPYGDQVLTVRRSLFFHLGGYAHRRPEDLDLVIRLKRHARLRLLEPPITTSGRRWLKEGYVKTTIKNWLFLIRHLVERAFSRRWPERGELEKISGGEGQGF